MSGFQGPLLTRLQLTYCHGLTNAGLAALQCPLLAKLNLMDCPGLTSLAGLECPLLTGLDLEDCSGLRSLAGLKCPLLTTLNLTNCIDLTEADLAALQCPLLAELNLLGCSGLAIPRKHYRRTRKAAACTRESSVVGIPFAPIQPSTPLTYHSKLAMWRCAPAFTYTSDLYVIKVCTSSSSVMRLCFIWGSVLLWRKGYGRGYKLR
jgi:hypothetical protein